MTVEIISDSKNIAKVMFKFQNDIFNKKLSKKDLCHLANKFSKKAIFLVGKEEKKEVGYIAFYCNDIITRCAFISMIIIDNAYQGIGYGRRLLDAAIIISKNNNMKKIQLCVSKSNTKAQSFYCALGFRSVSSDGDDLLVEKIL